MSDGAGRGSGTWGEAAGLSCHVCDRPIHGEPAGHGLIVFYRGDHWVSEEPPLCQACALAIGAAVRFGWAEDEDEG
jgi:hypothetical protein